MPPSLTSATEPSSSGDLRLVIRKNVIRLGLSLVGIGVLAALLVSQFDQELQAITNFVFERFGLLGVTFALFITDAFVSPLPPDSLLMLIARSPHHAHWPTLITGLGVISCLAGYAGYGMGLVFSRTHLLDTMFRKVREQSRDQILKYGSWAIILGALTPVPFSITCWTAGLMHVPFRSVWWPCTLRIPRYLLYYAAIFYVPQLLL